ncbi:double-strand-break repair protein rad21 homolog isoform X1 [Leptopilina heterotoma]|uniref:double-strand-break repair protein rad21 homolog isoform X1 n=1 Tax=Leptopilina heterotoma TaxID=63436 RepID=UPI001CA7C876|nr:double-strand-break repair protein rad21 homolog isoform X1 [Leptopilina heterotoma]XP_043462434.1 double-strand-break repair protein rad21 homolog isoform X1 [Leptopilina heterotoma]
MFYAHFVLAKKGPLARIWLAAHWDKKLTKAHVFETNIEKSVDGILQPKVKMALRTSGHLLLGVVRIYSRKAKYLLADCNEAFVKIKMAFRPGMVDLPEEHREAAVNAITLPEVFHDFDTPMPELKDVDIEAQFSLNQSRAEEITMREDYGSLSLATHDQGFGDMSFDAEPPELLRHATSMEPTLDQGHMLFSEPGMEPSLEQKEKEPVAGTSATAQPMDIDTPIRDDGFGGHLGQDIISGGLFEGGLFDEAPMGEVPVPEVSSITDQQEAVSAAAVTAASIHNDSDDDDMGDHFGGGAPSPMGGMSSSDGSRAATPAMASDDLTDRASVASRRFTPAPPSIAEDHAMDSIEDIPPPVQEQTTLLHDEEESFALAPVDASALKGFTKAKRKRKLIVDEVKNISGEEMKAQLSDTSDIVTTLDLAPPTKRLMHWKETGGVEKLFALPGRPIPARVLFKNYQRHLTSKSYDHEDFGRIGGEEDAMPLEQMREAGEPEPTFEQSFLGRRSGRKRKAPADEELRQSEDFGQLSIGAEPVDGPSLIPQTPMPATPMPGDVSLPQEPSIPDISGMMASVEPSEIMEPVPEVPAALSLDIPQIPPSDVSSLLGTNDELPIPQADEQLEHPSQTPLHHGSSMEHLPQIPISEPIPNQMQELEQLQDMSHLPQMENMGYDQTQPPVSYMGFDEHQPAAHTPGAISERGGPASPWNQDDYEFPPSVGPQEEQQVDETYEQFEERVLNKRAAHMYHVIKSKLETKDRLTLAEMAYKNNRKQAAQKFYTLLVLKKFQVLELMQEYSYADIVVTKGPKFENPAL